MKDKYTAVWVSHSSITDFLKCPRAYFLHNIYKSPKTGHKITIVSPPLALGQTVHEIIESLSNLPVEKRFEEPLIAKFDKAWKKVSGITGGFSDKEIEYKYKKRGEEMLSYLGQNPGPLKNLAVKIKMDLPYYYLSEQDNIILCGKIDWLEYLPESDSVHIIDFKTGRGEEDPQSFQLLIYYLLASNCQTYPVVKASYWYLDQKSVPKEQIIPKHEEAEEKILKLGKQIKLARQLNIFKCKKGDGCSFCRPYEQIIRGEGIMVGVDDMRRDIYVLEKKLEETNSIIH